MGVAVLSAWADVRCPRCFAACLRSRLLSLAPYRCGSRITRRLMFPSPRLACRVGGAVSSCLPLPCRAAAAGHAIPFAPCLVSSLPGLLLILCVLSSRADCPSLCPRLCRSSLTPFVLRSSVCPHQALCPLLSPSPASLPLIAQRFSSLLAPSHRHGGRGVVLASMWCLSCPHAVVWFSVLASHPPSLLILLARLVAPCPSIPEGVSACRL